MSTIRALVSTATLVIALVLVWVAMLLSPLQDWNGNVDEVDIDRILVVSAGLALGMVLGIVGAFACGRPGGRSAVILRTLNVAVAVIALLVGIVKWFPNFEG